MRLAFRAAFLAASLLAASVLPARAQTAPVKLPEGTPITVKLLEALGSNTSKKGETIRFEVAEDVAGPNHEVLIARGATAVGTVLRASKRRTFGRPGKLEVSVDSVRAVDGSIVPLRSEKDVKVRGHSNVTATAAVAVLATPLGLFINGRDARLKKGQAFQVYVSHDAQIDPARPAPPTAPASNLS